eukprot:Blabericola_migrator_1__2927@NODE_1841_length_3692_cov_288_665655_g1178_i0_p2_GENE_NODE_1841_length_3692_cov_288_665655_g1178_i0NODE_1841_length_3692_cov_288_665655_g1178_i0_p2_ORF_typecomplete_len148_score7_99Sensor/PF13796_6/6_3e02Sensor/PF13796_6/0_12Myc_target_1/PF15179_6/3_6e03Myc_target_1/PF15179_6/0_063Caveolin/PF01146_17/0_2_NODE_1841_length_3692_cov_288_665655_g1178_i09061349
MKRPKRSLSTQSHHSAPGTWNHASWCLGRRKTTRRTSFSESVHMITDLVVNSCPFQGPINVPDTWRQRAPKPVADQPSYWRGCMYATLFIIVSFCLAIVCGCVLGILVFRPVIVFNTGVRKDSTFLKPSFADSPSWWRRFAHHSEDQ